MDFMSSRTAKPKFSHFRPIDDDPQPTVVEEIDISESDCNDVLIMSDSVDVTEDDVDEDEVTEIEQNEDEECYAFYSMSSSESTLTASA